MGSHSLLQGYSRPKDLTQVSCNIFFIVRATSCQILLNLGFFRVLHSSSLRWEPGVGTLNALPTGSGVGGPQTPPPSSPSAPAQLISLYSIPLQPTRSIPWASGTPLLRTLGPPRQGEMRKPQRESRGEAEDGLVQAAAFCHPSVAARRSKSAPSCDRQARRTPGF